MFIDPSYLTKLQPTWSFWDPLMQELVSSQQINQNASMSIPSSYFRDQSYYKVRVNYTNPDYTFLVYYDLMFVP
jgi:hypothetical protein